MGRLAPASSARAQARRATARAYTTLRRPHETTHAHPTTIYTGSLTQELHGVINGVARLPGYMVPLEDHLEEVTEFLLVPDPGTCIHVPLPSAHQIVHVIMEGQRRAQVRLWMEAVWVESTLRLAEATTGEGALSSFQLTGTLIQSYKQER